MFGQAQVCLRDGTYEMKRATLPFAALLGAMPLAVAAQTITLDEIVVSANLAATKASRTGATVDVVTQPDLQATGDLTLSQYLARLPGLSLTRNGGLGTTSTLRIRGLGSAYSTVRIDGIDVGDPSGTQSGFEFGSLVTGNLSRVEVLRGSQSALYGSEAVAGVIDIQTARATEEGTTVKVATEGGSFGTRQASASIGTKSERGELAFSATRLKTDGISAAAAGTERDGFATTFLSFYGAYDLTDTVRIGANGFWRDSDLSFDGLVFDPVTFESSVGDTTDTESSTLRGGRVFAEFSTGAIAHELSVSNSRTERHFPGGFTEEFVGERTALNYKGSVDLSATLGLTFGAEWTDERFVAVGDSSGAIRTTSVFAEAQYALTPDVDLAFALRQDEPSDFDGKTTGRLAAAWRLRDDVILRGVYGTGFRAPSLFERFSAFGVPGLRPETSRSAEIGVEKLFGNGGSVQATLFDITITDRIDFDSGSTVCNSGFGCYNQVPGDTESRGLELSGRLPVAEGWTVFGNYTYADVTQDSSAGTARTIRVPRHDLTLGVEAQMTEALKAVVTLQHVADVLDATSFGNPDAPLPDYTLVNATLTYTLSDKAEAYVRLENLLDEDYQTIRGYAQPGRSVFVGLRASF